MEDDSGAKEILNYTFLRVFANDDTIDAEELAYLKELALRDGKVDDSERTVLRNILKRVAKERVEPEVWKELQEFREKYKLD